MSALPCHQCGPGSIPRIGVICVLKIILSLGFCVFRSGSVIADVELIFNRSVAKGAIEELIKESLKDNKLGDLDVGQSKIDGFIPG